MIERDRRGADADHRHPAGVPGGGRVCGDDLPAPPAAGAQAAQGRGRRPPGRCLSPSARRCSRCCTSERFVDLSPEETYATLLDEGTYLCSTRTMYRILAAKHGGVRERRDSAHPPRLREARAARRAAERALVVGHHEAAGPGEVDLLLPVRDPRRVQPLRRRLDRAVPRERPARQGADRAGHRAAADHPQDAHAARRPRRPDARQAGRVPARRPRRHEDALAARTPRTTTRTRGALQDPEVPARVPRPVRRHRARPRALPRVLRLVQPRTTATPGSG